MPCVSFFVFSAGCSQEARSTVVNNTATSIVNRVTQSSQVSIANLVTNLQKIEIVNKPGAEIKCNLKLSQVINASMKVSNTVTSTQASEIKNELKEMMINEVKTVANNNPSLWQSIFGKAVNSTSISEVTNDLSANFDNTVTQQSLIDVLNSTVNSQEQTVTNYGILSGDQCDFSQDILVKFQANNLVTVVQNSLLTNQVFRDIQNKLDTAAGSDKNAGGGKKGGKKGSRTFWIIFFIILGLAVIVGIGYALYRRSRRNAAETIIRSVAGPQVGQAPIIVNVPAAQSVPPMPVATAVPVAAARATSVPIPVPPATPVSVGVR